MDRLTAWVLAHRRIEVVVPAGRAPPATAALARVDGVAGVVRPPAWRRDGRVLAAVLPRQDAATDAGARTLDDVRAAAARFGARAGGPTAQTADLTDAIYGSFIPMLALIAAITLILLGRAFRSAVLPIKAVALNVFSVGAAFGIIVLIWQEGHGSGLFGIQATGAITSWVPLAMFAFLFGLSMDYEVFILSRIREAYDAHGRGHRPRRGRRPGRHRPAVTSAALILCLAFVALGAAPGTELKIFATGLAAGILLDATVVRALVVPALVTLLGEANWWLPRRRQRAA